MKTLIKLLVIGMFVITSSALLAQDGPPLPNGGSDPGENNDPVGGRATVSGGMVLMLALGAAYGGKKVYELRKKSV